MIALSLWASVGYATPSAQLIPAYNMAVYDKAINHLYQTMPALSTLEDRINIISAHFLEAHYLLGALGEGVHAYYDQSPIYRVDAFDCTTYVSTVLALTESHNLAEFKHKILAINYRNGRPVYVERNHFIEIDWNPNNQQKGYLQDITAKIIDASGQSIAEKAITLIDKPNWFRHLKATHLKFLLPLSDAKQQQRLRALHNEAGRFQVEKAETLYLPLIKLFNSSGEPDAALFAQIPSGTIIEIVCPNCNLKGRIGTNLNISHMGFAIRTAKGLMFREASSIEHKVIDKPLAKYLKNYLHDSAVKGINLQRINLVS